MIDKWSHGVCTDCWVKRRGKRVTGNLWDIPRPMRTKPDLMQWAPRNCCLCGRWTTSGISIKEDPNKTFCRGEHGEAG